MPSTNIPGADNYALQSVLSAYSDEAYTTAKKLNSTGLVGSNPLINKDTETFMGQLRWFKPMNPVINVASIVDATPGNRTDYGSEFLNYIKTVRTSGAMKVNMKQVVTQSDGLKKYGRDWGELRAQDTHDGLLSVLKGVAISEALLGTGVASGQAGLGGQTFENDPTDKRYGFYVDLGSAVVTDATAGNMGAQRANAFLNAVGMAYKDYEPEFFYLIVNPAVMASLRSANLIDDDRVQDGNISFNTLFQGKFRLIQTRANQSLMGAELTKLNTGAGVDIAGTRTSFVCLPGAIAHEELTIPEPVEMDTDPKAYHGGGTTEIWHRWGYVNHPAGYNWAGPSEDFVTNAQYMSVNESGTNMALTDTAATTVNVTGAWTRKTNSALSLAILPIFHS